MGIAAQLCTPALLYLLFSLTYIFSNIYVHHYGSALLHFLMMCVITLALNMLCEQGLFALAWLIVFIPFITMTIISAVMSIVIMSNKKNVLNK